MKTKTRMCLSFMVLLLTTAARAQNENLKIRFNFENVSGAQVTDEVSGIKAQVKGPAKVIKMGQFHVLDLSRGTDYLNMTASAGTLLATTLQTDHAVLPTGGNVTLSIKTPALISNDDMTWTGGVKGKKTDIGGRT